MESKLDVLLRQIDPDRMHEYTKRAAEEALNSFDPVPMVLKSYDEFVALMTRFFVHAECIVLATSKRQLQPPFDWNRCCEHLRNVYGKEGRHAAASQALSGHAGGLPAVLREVARDMAAQYVAGENAARIGQFWASLSPEEKLEAPLEYVRKCGHLLPAELVADGAPRIRAYFPDYLKQHAQLIDTLRRSARPHLTGS